MNIRPKSFYLGLFLLCSTVLLLQITQTRLLSVISWYYLAFFAISMAMFGMTAGALWIYVRSEEYAPDRLGIAVARITLTYAVSIVLCAGFELASVAEFFTWATVIFVWAKLLLLLTPPFFFAGMAVSLALTRSPFPIGLVYGVDLAGAASGCLLAVLLLDMVDAPSALIAVAAIAALAAACFAHAQTEKDVRQRRPRVTTARAAALAAAFAGLCAANASTIWGLQPIAAKMSFEERGKQDYERWNSFSRVVAYPAKVRRPFMWGPSPLTPGDLRIEQRWMNIDGDAATSMPRFNGDLSSVRYLDYDLTNLAYSIRNHGRAAVIGVGGGRDILSAHYFGFRDITGVELNPIFIDLLTNPRRYREFSGLADLPNVRFVVDDARSWFARTKERFDLVEMSLVDTWAATGAGGFTLSENGLYTVEGWLTFLRSLTPNGVFTVSRWYSPDYVMEAGRAVSLALATLFELGVKNPRDHIFMAAQFMAGQSTKRGISTLVISRAPFSAEDLARLRATAEHYQHKILLTPDQAETDAVFRKLMAARSTDELETRAAQYTLDLFPATDSRPFFFNLLSIEPTRFWAALTTGFSAGVVRGNLAALRALLLIIVLSALMVLCTIVIPVRSSVRALDRRLALAGTAYFLLIGLGFMLVEIGLIQRISIFLGHPVYALSIGLFSIILATGLGSFISELVVLRNFGRFAIWVVLLTLYLAALPSWFPLLTTHFQSAEIVTRALVCMVAIIPAGILMGFGFPTGMRLANASDPAPTPWFWGINGAAGVLAAGIAVACSIATSIDVTLRLGAVAYLGLLAAGLLLFASARRVSAGATVDRRAGAIGTEARRSG